MERDFRKAAEWSRLDDSLIVRTEFALTVIARSGYIGAMKLNLGVIAFTFLASWACSAQESHATRRMLEPESGVEFALDERWSRDLNAGNVYGWNKDKDAGQLHIRFPMDIKPTPASAVVLRDSDLRNAKAKLAWKKELTKVKDKRRAETVTSDGIRVLISALSLQRDQRELIRRTFYLTTPDAYIVAVECTLPKESIGSDDRCIEFIKSAKLMTSDERQLRGVEQALRRRLEDAADNQGVQCADVLAENKEFRDFYPQAQLQDIPRLAFLTSILQTASPKKTYGTQIAPINRNDIAQALQQVVQTCMDSPDKTYIEAVKAAWPLKLGVLTRLSTRSEK